VAGTNTSLNTMVKHKLPADKMPKKMQELKGYLDGFAEGITGSALEKAPADMRRSAVQAMVRCMPPLAKTSYKSCVNDKERYQWVAEYMMDPSKVKHHGAAFTSKRLASKTDTDTWVWITERELAGASYLNSEANAKMAISTCDSRIHADNTALAAAGVMQYHWNLKQTTLHKTINEGISLECKADLTHEGYKQLSQHMGNSSNPDGVKTKGSKRMKALENDKDAGMSPEKKAIKAGFARLSIPYCSRRSRNVCFTT
jgi:hypothetical protein